MVAMGGGDSSERGRGWWLAWASVVGLFAVGCWWLTAALWEPGQSGADRADVLAVVPGLVSAVLSAVAVWAALRGARPAPDPDAELSGLARAVADERRRFLDQALGVAWRADPARLAVAHPEPGVLPAPVESTLLNWQDVDGREVGTIADIAGFYRQVDSGRLVVLGAPGAGKTVLLSRLVLDLVEARTEADGTVPVLLSLPSWDVGPLEGVTSRELADRLQRWIVGRLVEDYGLRPGRADRLVRDGRVLPVLDGLDEMDPALADASGASGVAGRPRAVAVIRALNTGTRHPVVVACRHDDYLDITSDAVAGRGSVGRLVNDSRHVAVRPLDAAAIRAYLTGRFHGPDGRVQARWEPVIAVVERGEPIAEVLATPWELFLAVTAYGPAGRDPGDLLGLPVDQVRALLLEQFVPAVVEADEDAEIRGWDSVRCTAWLTALAKHQRRQALEHGRSETDILLPDLWRIADRDHARWLPPILAAGPLIALGVAIGVVDGDLVTLILGCVGGVGVFIVAADVADAAIKRLALDRMRRPRARRHLGRTVARRLMVDLAIGLAMGLVIGLTVIGFVGGLAAGLAAGLMIGLVAGLAVGLVEGLTVGLAADAAASAATRLVRQGVTYSVTAGLVFGLPVGLLAGLVLAPVLALALAFVVALPIAVAYANGHLWVRYALGVRSAARRGLLPCRPARFLDWCLERGLMRMAGNAVQFRHRQHQDWLAGTTSRATSPRVVELAAPEAEATRGGGTVGGGT
jgi:hypothetical protein